MNKKKVDNTDFYLEDMYRKIMKDFSFTSFQLSNGVNNNDRYKQYSVCDLSKYETVLSSNIIVKN